MLPRPLRCCGHLSLEVHSELILTTSSPPHARAPSVRFAPLAGSNVIRSIETPRVPHAARGAAAYPLSARAAGRARSLAADCLACYTNKPSAAALNLGVSERPSLIEESTHMNRKSFLVGLLAAGCFVAMSTLMTSPGNAQADPKVAKAMAILKAETAKLGVPKVERTDQTADKTTPGLYFGSTKVNNDFTIVDKVKAEAGGTATLFVKSGDDYVRVSTNVPGSA